MKYLIIIFSTFVLSACNDDCRLGFACNTNKEDQPIVSNQKQKIAFVKPKEEQVKRSDITIGVKGFYLGMDQDQFITKFNTTVHEDGSSSLGDIITDNKFTIAGAAGPFGNVSIQFTKNKKLGHVLFFFYPHEFDQIKNALNSKYHLTCEQGIVQNALGQKFDQEKCNFVNTNGDSLVITKRLDRDTGTLEMTSVDYNLQKIQDKNLRLNKARNDI